MISLFSALGPFCRCLSADKLIGNDKCTFDSNNEIDKSKMCYVVLPSNCTDLKNSTIFNGLQISEEACLISKEYWYEELGNIFKLGHKTTGNNSGQFIIKFHIILLLFQLTTYIT